MVFRIDVDRAIGQAAWQKRLTLQSPSLITTSPLGSRYRYEDRSSFQDEP
jgi:hypothetical protein